MQLKLDENLGRRSAEILAEAGHDVATVPGEDLCRTSDQDLARVCRAEGRCLVTLDLDFGNPLVFKPADLERALRVLIAGLEAEPVVGKLWIVEPATLREYQPEN